MMFENPIKGSVGSFCKKIAGIVYGTGLILIALTLFSNIIPIFTENNTSVWLYENKDKFPLWLISIINANRELQGSCQMLVLLNAVLVAAKSFVRLGAIVLALNILGDWTTNIAIIANQMSQSEKPDIDNTDESIP
jgi:hypothetical protein